MHPIKSNLDDVGNNVKYYAHNEELFDIIKAAHIETGLGGLYKIHDSLKTEYVNITQTVILIFLSLCEIFVRKRSHPKKGVVMKPMVFKEISERAQVDLIDMQFCKDEDYVN